VIHDQRPETSAKKRRKKKKKKEKTFLALTLMSSVSEMIKDKLWVPLTLGRHGTSVFYA
jgi:hypothetical protein